MEVIAFLRCLILTLFVVFESSRTAKKMQGNQRKSKIEIEPNDRRMQGNQRKSIIEIEPNDRRMQGNQRKPKMEIEPKDRRMQGNERKSKIEMQQALSKLTPLLQGVQQTTEDPKRTCGNIFGKNGG